MEERSRFTSQSGRQHVVSCRRRRDVGFALEFIVDDGAKRKLKVRDGQHLIFSNEYTFEEK